MKDFQVGDKIIIKEKIVVITEVGYHGRLRMVKYETHVANGWEFETDVEKLEEYENSALDTPF